MDLIYITNDPHRAATAEQAGVDRIMVDLEIRGKEERQGHRNTVISRHTMADVVRMAKLLKNSTLMVRVNPLFEGSGAEIDEVLDLGAKIIMLPMFTSANQVSRFVQLVGGKGRTSLLLETGPALARIDEILEVPGIDEIHIGLNDLHLALGLDFMFELLSGGIVEYLASKIRDRGGVKFGFGGVARIGSGALDSRLILLEHLRLGSTQVILSRDFGQIFDLPGGEEVIRKHFCDQVAQLRGFLEQSRTFKKSDFAANQKNLVKTVRSIVAKTSEAKNSVL